MNILSAFIFFKKNTINSHKIRGHSVFVRLDFFKTRPYLNIHLCKHQEFTLECCNTQHSLTHPH